MLNSFGKQLIVDMLVDAECSYDVTRHSEQLKKNRWIFCRFVDVVCSLAEQEYALRGHDGTSIAVNRPHCAEFRNFLKNNGPVLEIV